MASSSSLQVGTQQPTESRTPPLEISPHSSETSHTRLTPNSDSEHDDDFAIDDAEADESYSMMRVRGEGREKVWDAEEEGGSDSSEGDEEDDRDGGRRRRASVSTVQSYQLYTPDEEKEVVKIFDKKLVLFVALLYMLSFLDRSSQSFPPCLLKLELILCY